MQEVLNFNVPIKRKENDVIFQIGEGKQKEWLGEKKTRRLENCKKKSAYEKKPVLQYLIQILATINQIINFPKPEMTSYLIE